MTHSENITFRSNNETLASTIDWNAAKDKPTILSLHGGGESTSRTRAAYLTEELARAGYSCLRFDFSGQGESTGVMQQSSMKKRFDEALAAVQFMEQNKPLTVIGTSMGGPTAMELTRHLNVGSVILFCPAIYAADAFDKPFDERFTNILRRDNSFMDADTALLENFTGNFLHIIGAIDGVIPPGVTAMYQQHMIKAKKCDFIRIDACGHQIHSFLKDHDKERARIVTAILRMME